MSDVQIMNRILSYHSEVNSQNIRSGNIDKNIDYGKIANCASEISDLKLKIDTNTKYVEDLESEIRVLNIKMK
jgi:replicative DNA helicase